MPGNKDDLDYEAMTIDEIDVVIRQRKDEIEEKRRGYDAIADVRRRKVQEMHEAEARVQLEGAAQRFGIPVAKMAEIWLADEQPGHTTQAQLYLGIHKSQRPPQTVEDDNE